MITEDQLEQLAIQWLQDTGWNHVHGAVIAPEGVAAVREALRTLTPALSHGEKEEDGRLVEARRRVAMPGQVSHGMTKQGVGKEPGQPLNKERRYPIALPMRGPLGEWFTSVHGHSMGIGGRIPPLLDWYCPVGAEERDTCGLRARVG